MTEHLKTPFHFRCLKIEFERRQSRNPRYSLRSFARALGIDPSSLSRMLNDKQDLSLQLSRKVIQKLPLSDEERREFISSVAEMRRERAVAFLSQSNDTPEII